MGRPDRLLDGRLLDDRLPHGRLPHSRLPDRGRVIDRLLLAGGRLVCGLVLGGLPPGIRGRVGFLLRRDWGHGGDWVIVAVVARAGGSQQSQRARGSEHPNIYHSHMI